MINWKHSSVGLEHLPYKQGVHSPNLCVSTTYFQNMRFIDFTFIGRSTRCAILKAPSGETVYCLFGVYHYLTHNPSLHWEIVSKVFPRNGRTYKFVHIVRQYEYQRINKEIQCTQKDILFSYCASSRISDCSYSRHVP